MLAPTALFIRGVFLLTMLIASGLSFVAWASEVVLMRPTELDAWQMLGYFFVCLMIHQGMKHGIRRFGMVLVTAMGVGIMRWAYLEMTTPYSGLLITAVGVFLVIGYRKAYRESRKSKVSHGSNIAYQILSIDYEDGCSGGQH